MTSRNQSHHQRLIALVMAKVPRYRENRYGANGALIKAKAAVGWSAQSGERIDDDLIEWVTQYAASRDYAESDQRISDLVAQAEAVTTTDALLHQSYLAYAATQRGDEDALRIFSEVWERNARHMAEALHRYPNEFVNNPSVNTLLCLFALCRLPEAQADNLKARMASHTLAYHEVRREVNKTLRASQPKRNSEIECPHCGQSFTKSNKT